ncbi:uncharacterized protein LOC100313559 [Saccoglossus kowalevskii]|uniref:HMG box transcription factor BBX n=2 Tax=Saccoglossus kowalevskii TaxID=10224 RepID=A0ABM0MN39_SACKO|nr:PREDICTED: HMG box transcription factor BBX [Saccoglossus kowalevskii]
MKCYSQIMATEIIQPISIKEEIPPPVSLEEDDDDDLNDDRPVRRPMNAFLLFCKRHRSLVKERHPWLDNRSATKMLADMWAVLEGGEKEKYLELARQCKAAFLKAYPDYKWCGTSKTQINTPSSPTVTTRKMQADSTIDDKGCKDASITPGKLADPADMGGLNLLLMAGEQALSPSSQNTSNNSSPESKKSEISAKNENNNTSSSYRGNQSTLFEFAQMCSEQASYKQEPKDGTTNKAGEQTVNQNSASSNKKAGTVSPTESANESKINSETRTERKKKKKSKKHSDDGKQNKDTEKKRKKNKHLKPSSESEEKSTEKPKKRKKNRPEEKMKKKKTTKQEENKMDDSESANEESVDIALKTGKAESEPEHELDESEPEDSKSGNRCRKSSRSCKGQRYKQFVSGGMLHDLQRPERPFNCKRPWKADFTSYSDEDDPTVDLESKAAKRRRAAAARRRRVSESCVGGSREGRSQGERRSLDVLDYADFDFKAKLDSLPQFTLDQFKPKSKSQTRKKCTNMYKNAVFVRKGNSDDIVFDKDLHHFANDDGDSGDRERMMPQLTGSQKRKARKRSITHIVRTTSSDGFSKVTITTPSTTDPGPTGSHKRRNSTGDICKQTQSLRQNSQQKT